MDVLDGIAFGREDLATSVHEGDHIDVVARVMSRVFNGYESLQLDIRDVAPAGWHDRQTAAVADLTSVNAPVMALAGAPA